MHRWILSTLGVLADLILPSACAACGATGSGQLCGDCAGGLAALAPLPAVPTPVPAGLPRCVALGSYEGPMQGLLIAYKERGAHRLSGPLGDHLGRAVAAALAGVDAGTPVVLIPVPDTAAARRERHGDHMSRLARRTARTLRRAGWSVAIGHGLSALPKADSSHLGADARAVTAAHAFRVRPTNVHRIAAAARAGARVVVIDDILTTGSTLAAVTSVLADAGIPVYAGVTLAATRRKRGFSSRLVDLQSSSDVVISS